MKFYRPLRITIIRTNLPKEMVTTTLKSLVYHDQTFVAYRR